MTTNKFTIPADIRTLNARKAYLVGVDAARKGKKLDFVAPKVRWAIARGWKVGEGARKFDAFVAMKRAAVGIS